MDALKYMMIIDLKVRTRFSALQNDNHDIAIPHWMKGSPPNVSIIQFNPIVVLINVVLNAICRNASNSVIMPCCDGSAFVTLQCSNLNEKSKNAVSLIKFLQEML